MRNVNGFGVCRWFMKIIFERWHDNRRWQPSLLVVILRLRFWTLHWTLDRNRETPHQIKHIRDPLYLQQHIDDQAVGLFVD
jgi:hypothetical protein